MKNIEFPRDERLHSKGVEWWYWNGFLTDEKNRNHAFMASLFRVKIPGLRSFWFIHTFITSIKDKKFDPYIRLFFKGLDRGSFPRGKLEAGSRGVFRIIQKNSSIFDVQIPRLKLHLVSVKPPMKTGGTGHFDLKASESASYSLTRLEASGELTDNEKVLAVKGLAWMDHQWSPVRFDNEHAWDWFSIQLDDGTDISVFDFGRRVHARLATISFPDGNVAATEKIIFKKIGDAWKSLVTGAEYPLSWKIVIPEHGIEMRVDPVSKNQEMIFGLMNYWEGPISVKVTVNKKIVYGRGFMELVGKRWGKSYFKYLFQKFYRFRP
ncbi:MAG: lipocalin family protein [Patescibacteria group bacterium]